MDLILADGERIPGHIAFSKEVGDALHPHIQKELDDELLKKMKSVKKELDAIKEQMRVTPKQVIETLKGMPSDEDRYTFLCDVFDEVCRYCGTFTGPNGGCSCTMDD